MNISPLILIDFGFDKIFSSNYIWIIVVGMMVLVMFWGWKKNKKEKEKKSRRESEVKAMIKKYLEQKNGIKNVAISFVEVVARTTRRYQDRDVFDIFIEVHNNKKKKKIVTRKSYEIEGIATNIPHKYDSKDFVVAWKINEEFDYSTHLKFVKYTAVSVFKIYLRSLRQKNKKKYIKIQKEKLKNWKIKEKKIEEEIKKRQNKIDEKNKIFRPKLKENK